MNVSVICPTYNRPSCHKNLYRVFDHQTYQDKELVVLDDSHEPSPFFSELRDERVKYYHLPKRMILGLKRNLLIEKSAGEVIAHFDDDDYYAPEYLATMVPHLKTAAFVKLSKWLSWREIDKTLWLWDTSYTLPSHYRVVGAHPAVDMENLSRLNDTTKQAFIDQSLWGFGFSYVYLKQAALLCLFESMNHGEDYNFFLRFRGQGNVCSTISNAEQLALHFLYKSSESLIYPQFSLPSPAVKAIFGDGIKDWIVSS